MSANLAIADTGLTEEEAKKRQGLASRKPYVASKLAKISEMEAKGEISPIIRLEKSYLCNFQCTHCSAEYYMDRHLKNVIKIKDEREQMSMEDVRRLSRQADELGLARFVITGGEPLVMKDFDAVVEALDPDKHYIITDTNGWFLDSSKAKHLKSIGVEKVQLSLDSFIEEEHDNFRNKKRSYQRVMRAVDASLDAGLNLLLSTVLVKGRAKTKEFEDMCKFATDRGVGLYVSYAKPTGSCTDHPEFVITKEDADIVRELEKKYNVFTHMTPSYGSYKGCITVKGIVTITSTMEVTPCPYIDMSLGNLRTTHLREVLSRGMKNPWLGPYRPDCIIGEDPKFIKIHTEKTANAKLLPLPYGKGFSDEDSLHEDSEINRDEISDFDVNGRCNPNGLTKSTHKKVRNYFKIKQPKLELDEIYDRFNNFLPGEYLSKKDFKEKINSLLKKIKLDSTLKNMLNGTHVPFMFPKVSFNDLGIFSNDILLLAVKKSFESSFAGRSFTNHYSGDMKDTFIEFCESNQNLFKDNFSKRPSVGLYFPVMREYSVAASIERTKTLPSGLILSGIVDTSCALIGSPDLLINDDAYPPLLWIAGEKNNKNEESFCFEAYGWNLTFNKRVHFNKATEQSTCGLSILAE